MKVRPNKIVCFLLLLACISLSACKKSIPATVIQPKKMELLLYDYHLAKAMADDLPSDDRYKQSLYLDYVFKKYNTTEEAFDSSMVWYTRHTNELNKIYENVNKRFKQEQEVLDKLIARQENKPLTSVPGDSVEVWYQHRIQHLLPYPLVNKLEFMIPVDTNYKQRDLFVWKMDYSFLHSSDTAEVDSAIMALSIKLTNDSLVSAYKKVVSPGMDSLVLTSDSLYDLKEVRGFIYYPGKDTSRELLLSKISLMRYHRYFNDSIDVAADILSVVTESKEEVVAETGTSEQIVKTDTVKADTVRSTSVRRSPQEMREESRRAGRSE